MHKMRPSPASDVPRKRTVRPIPSFSKRAHSAAPLQVRPHPSTSGKIDRAGRRCQSLSPSVVKKSMDLMSFPPESVADSLDGDSYPQSMVDQSEKDVTLPQCLITKLTRQLATKKREFVKMRKSLLSYQNSVLEQFAALKDLAMRANVGKDETLGELKVVSVSKWPAHDLLLLVRDDITEQLHGDLTGAYGQQVIQQIQSQLNPIPEEVLALGAELMARRLDMINIMRGKHNRERANYHTNIEWKAKNQELDQETEKLHRMVAGIAENLKAKLSYSMELAKIAWLDRESLIKKMDRLQKENMLLQHKLEDFAKKEVPDGKESTHTSYNDNQQAHFNYQELREELSKERAAREALKDVVSAAEGMLRVARSRIATLERQIKDMKAELDAAHRKHKELEQLCRHRENTYDARSKKLMEVSKTGEITIETLSRQRDALELRRCRLLLIRVKELHDLAMKSEKAASAREMQQRSRVDQLLAQVEEQNKKKEIAENKIRELEFKVKELEDILQSLREKSVKLVNMERKRCLEYVPTKEGEPSDRETEIWKELQVTRLALSRAEDELKQTRTDKENFLNTLAKIAEEGDKGQDKFATELLDREQKISKLQAIIAELRENEKSMENSMTQYENQLASLRVEVKRLRNYDCYFKEIPYPDIETELLELHMQVETMSRERSALVSAAASRALMLERYERSADLFTRITRARRDLAAALEGCSEPPAVQEQHAVDFSKSLTMMCGRAAQTWSALQTDRARVLKLEEAVLAQSIQLDREARVRTQLERRRAKLEREVLRVHHSICSDPPVMQGPTTRNPLSSTFANFDDGGMKTSSFLNSTHFVEIENLIKEPIRSKTSSVIDDILVCVIIVIKHIVLSVYAFKLFRVCDRLFLQKVL